MEKHLVRRALRMAATTTLLINTSVFGQSQDLVVGQILSLTGPAAVTAKELMHGRQACIEHTNAQGGVRGRRLRLVTKDDQGDPDRAVRLAQELAEREGAVVMLGSMGPAVNTGVLEWASNAGMTVVDPQGGDVENRVRGSETAYFLTANQSAEAERLAGHIASLGLSRVVIVHGLDRAGHAALSAIEEGLGVANVAAIALVAVKPDGSDAIAASQAVAKSGAQAVLLATSGKGIVAMLQALTARSTGGLPLLQVYGLSSAASQSELAELGARARGFSMSQVMPLPRDIRIPVVATFQAAMRAVPGERTYAELEGCIGALVLAEVLKRSKSSDFGRAAILQSMRSAGRVNVGGFEVDLSDRARAGARFTDIVYVGSDGRISR